jgi:hypothetical protein
MRLRRISHDLRVGAAFDRLAWVDSGRIMWIVPMAQPASRGIQQQDPKYLCDHSDRSVRERHSCGQDDNAASNLLGVWQLHPSIRIQLAIWLHHVAARPEILARQYVFRLQGANEMIAADGAISTNFQDDVLKVVAL